MLSHFINYFIDYFYFKTITLLEHKNANKDVNKKVFEELFLYSTTVL